MAMNTREPQWLIVQNLPSCFTSQDKMDLLRYFGAAFVKVSEANEAIAFAKFSSHEECSYALLKLHQQKVLGARLVVELSDDEPSDARINKQQESGKMDSQHLRDIRKLVRAIEVKDQTVLLNPKPKYAYPSPTPEIVHNIMNALLTIPKFYTQVLHLMNKMNLAPPFGPASEQSQVIRDYYAQQTIKAQQTPACTTTDEVVQEIPVPEEEDESELESEGEAPLVQQHFVHKPMKRKAPQAQPKKKPRLIDMMKPVITQKKEVKDAVPVHEVFESSANAVKNIQINVKKTIDEENTAEKTIASANVGGFGKIEPISKPATSEENQSDGEETVPTVISLQELRENLLPSEEWAKISAFKNYAEGEVSERLYIKNLAKKVEKKDLQHIYGRYVDWSNQVHVNVFDVRVMQEGRMKGQAFVNLPTPERALKALKHTNGYILKGKPMVVQFARSAKPKTEAPLL